MLPQQAMRREPRGHELWIAITIFVAAGYFYGGSSWNQNARLDAIFAFVEPGPERFTFRIDSFLPEPERGINTGDWSRVGGHYYANKAPGTLLLGALAYLPLYAGETLLGVDRARPALHHLNAYLINLCVSVLPISVACARWSRLLALRTGRRRSVLLALLTFLGTALFPYSTQLWGHVTAAAFVMLGSSLWPAARAGRRGALVAAGALLSLALTCDFLALPTFVAFGGLISPRLRRLAWFALGAAGPACLLLGYQWYCFADPLRLPTTGSNPEFVESGRVLGLFGGVSGQALFQLTLGTYRGLFLQMPVLLLASVGFLRWWQRDRSDPSFYAALGSCGVTLAWVASFNGWHGGAAVCARYLIVVLPLLGLALAELPRDRHTNVLLALLGLVSVVDMLAVSAVSPLSDSRQHNPLWDTLRSFAAGSLHPYLLPIRLEGLQGTPPEHLTAWNLGELMGLHGVTSILPWLALVSSGCVVAWLGTARLPAPVCPAAGSRAQ